MSSVIFEKEKNTLKISLNRISVLNAVNLSLLEELQQGLTDATANPEITALMLYGEGGCFSAGADINKLNQMDQNGLRKFHGLRETTFAMLENFPGPTFAAIEGYALGTGLELALSCDFRIADEGAHLGLPSAKLGIVESYEYSARLVRTVGVSQAKKIIFSGERLQAGVAFTVGLIEEVVPKGQLFKRSSVLIDRLSKNATAAIEQSKTIINECGRDPYLHSVEDTALPMAKSMTSLECKERLTAFLNKVRD